MTIDDRATAAAAELRARTSTVTVPSIEAVEGRGRARRSRLLVAGVAAVIFATAGGFYVANRGPATVVVPSSAPRPTGLATRTFAPPELRVSMSIPASWTQRFPASVTEVGSLYVLWDDQTSQTLHVGRRSFDGDLTKFGDHRVGILGTEPPATHLSRRPARVDGRQALEFRYRFPPSKGSAGVTDLEYDIDLGDGTFLTVILAENEPARARAVMAWVASTIRVK